MGGNRWETITSPVLYQTILLKTHLGGNTPYWFWPDKRFWKRKGTSYGIAKK